MIFIKKMDNVIIMILYIVISEISIDGKYFKYSLISHTYISITFHVPVPEVSASNWPLFLQIRRA